MKEEEKISFNWQTLTQPSFYQEQSIWGHKNNAKQSGKTLRKKPTYIPINTEY